MSECGCDQDTSRTFTALVTWQPPQRLQIQQEMPAWAKLERICRVSASLPHQTAKGYLLLPPPPLLPPSVNAKLQITSPLGLKTRLSVLISILSCALNMAPAAAGLEDQKRGCCFFLSGWSDYFKRSRQVGFRDGVTVVQALQCGFKLVISQAYFKHFSKIRRENAFIFWGWKVWKWSKRMVDDLSQQVDSCFQWNWDPSLCRLVEDQCTEVVSAGPLTL